MTMELFLFCIVLTLYRRHNFNLTWLYNVLVTRWVSYKEQVTDYSSRVHQCQFPGYLMGSKLFLFFLKFSLLRFSFFLSAFCISCTFVFVSLDCQFMIAASVFSNIYFQLCSNFFIRRSNLSTRTWQNDVVVEYSNGWLYMILTQA
jgi:hypothetical protein